MTNAYDAIYLNKATRTVGNMLHDAVLKYGYDGEEFLRMFLQSGVAEQIENGNPKYVAGRSFRDILEAISYEELLGRYDTLHEADVQKALDVLDAHMEQSESRLKNNHII